MIMYDIAVCDGCAMDREQLIRQIKNNKVNLDAKKFRIHEYCSDKELLKAVNDIHFAAMFLNIGIETAKKLRRLDPAFALVFYTGLKNPSPQSFEVEPYRYILKSMRTELIEKYVGDVLKKIEENERIPFLTANINKKQIVINPEHIIYIEKYKRSTRIHLEQYTYNQYGLKVNEHGVYSDIRSQETLHDIYEKLKKYGFGCPHGSYIINFQYLRVCTGKLLQLAGVNETFPIARSKSKDFHHQKECFIR